jgi:hypothetical protein
VENNRELNYNEIALKKLNSNFPTHVKVFSYLPFLSHLVGYMCIYVCVKKKKTSYDLAFVLIGG